jgi:hypothetical protein
MYPVRKINNYVIVVENWSMYYTKYAGNIPQWKGYKKKR